MNHTIWRLKNRAAALAFTLLATIMPALADTASEPKEVLINGVEFVLIPEGWFYKTGGIPEEGRRFQFLEEPGGGNVKVWLDSFYIAKYEARARDLAAFLNSSAGKGESYFGKDISCAVRIGSDGKYFLLRPEEDHPATHLTWNLADKWARWMGFRLPREVEWEKAARGTDQRRFPWGDQFPDETLAGFATDSNCYTWPVNSFLKGRSPYGIHNMAGNVREFVADWYNADFDTGLKDGVRNPVSPPTGSTQANQSNPVDAGPWKMLKGGRWASREEQLLIGYRDYYLPEIPFRCNGTRFALDVATVREHLAKGTARVITP